MSSRPSSLAALISIPLAITSLTAQTDESSALRATGLRCEYRENPLGVFTTKPRLSWVLRATGERARGLAQTAWRVLVASDPARLAAGEGDLWDSGVVRSKDSIHVVYGGEPLRARALCHWKVRVWDQRGRASPWSKPARWSMGLLAPEDWHGEWIGVGGTAGDTHPATEPWLRTTFDLPAAPRRAFAHVASLGYHELWANGDKVDDTVLTPGVSDLSQRTRARTYEVTGLLRRGRNALGLWLGGGWTRYPRYGVARGPLVLAELDVELQDGRTVRIVTDEGWRWQSSSVAHTGGWNFGNYGGERLDPDAYLADWSAPDCDDSRWQPATTARPDVAVVGHVVEPDRLLEELRPVMVEERGDGVFRVDFGRSFTGWTEARLVGEPGAAVTLTWSERDGQRCTYNQRSTCVLGPDGAAVFRHRFNYAAGRFVWIEGITEPPALEHVRGWLVRPGYRRAARFACSDGLLNQVQQTVAWTFECLSLGGYVVDCPHRERWGYGGDAHATMETALDHFALGAFYTKWLDDWRAIQDEHDNLPFTCPTYRGGGGPAWSGIVVALPWELYVRTGDRRVLEETWPTIDRWLAFLDTKCDGDVLQHYHDDRYTRDVYSFLGDWVPPGGVQRGGDKSEETMFFNNAYRLFAVRTAARIAATLGRDDDAARLDRRADEIAHVVHERFWDAEREVYVSGRQTYLALPLLAGLPPAPEQVDWVARLAEAIAATDGHVDTGIHGTWFLVKTLLAHGRTDLLHEIATKTDYPSWGHMLEQGATTIWEQWDAVNSHLHSSFLSIGAFFIEGVAGIRPDPEAPGYRHFHVHPGVVGDLTWARCELDTVRGTVVSDWRLDDGVLTLRVVVPIGARATVHVPAARAEDVTESGKSLHEVADVEVAGDDGRAVRCAIGAGEYRFRAVVN